MNIAKLYLTLAAVLFVSPSLIAQTSARYIFDGDAIATSTFSVTISGQTAQVAQYVTRLHVMGTGEAQPEDLQIFFTVKRNNALTIRQCDSWFKRVSGAQARLLPNAKPYPYLEITLPYGYTEEVGIDANGNKWVVYDANQLQCWEAVDLYSPGNN